MEGDGGEMRGEIKGDGGEFAWKVMVFHIYIMREREGVFWSKSVTFLEGESAT